MKDIIENLVKMNIEFMVIGSFSKLWNKIGTTYPRDLDIWIEDSISNLEYCKNEFGFTIDQYNVGVITKGNQKVNIFSEVTGLNFRTSLEQSNTKLLSENISIKYICEEDYIQNIKSTNKKWDF